MFLRLSSTALILMLVICVLSWWLSSQYYAPHFPLTCMPILMIAAFIVLLGALVTMNRARKHIIQQMEPVLGLWPEGLKVRCHSLIPWADIGSVEIFRFAGTKCIGVNLNEGTAESYAATTDAKWNAAIARALLFGTRKLPPIWISEECLPLPVEDVVALVCERRDYASANPDCATIGSDSESEESIP